MGNIPQRRNRFQKLVIAGCSRRCSMNPGNIPSELNTLIIKWFEDGSTINTVRANAMALGHTFSVGAIAQHRKNHLHNADQVERAADGPPKGELDILNEMIQAGARQVGLDSTRISAEQLLRAIELKQKLTEGSVFDAMYEAMKGVGRTDLDAPKPPADDPAVATQLEGDRDEA